MTWRIVLPFLGTLLAVGVCNVPGGFYDVNIKDPGFRKALTFAVDQYNSHSDSDYLYKVQLVVNAHAQVIEGMRYITTVAMAKTICKKDHMQHHCPINSNQGMAESFSCTFNVVDPIGKPMSLESQQCRRLQ